MEGEETCERCIDERLVLHMFVIGPGLHSINPLSRGLEEFLNLPEEDGSLPRTDMVTGLAQQGEREALERRGHERRFSPYV